MKNAHFIFRATSANNLERKKIYKRKNAMSPKCDTSSFIERRPLECPFVAAAFKNAKDEKKIKLYGSQVFVSYYIVSQ